jgi:tellurite resistance protein TehA-like permease
MKKLVIALTFVSLTTSVFSESLDDFKKDTEALWRVGTGSEDGSFTAISTSMLGWGVGLSAGIAILASVLHQSTSAHSHSDSD